MPVVLFRLAPTPAGLCTGRRCIALALVRSWLPAFVAERALATFPTTDDSEPEMCVLEDTLLVRLEDTIQPTQVHFFFTPPFVPS